MEGYIKYINESINFFSVHYHSVTIVFQGKIDFLRADIEPQLGLQPELEVLREHEPGRGQPRQQRHEAAEADGLPALSAEEGGHLSVDRTHSGLLHTRPVELGHHHPQQDLLIPKIILDEWGEGWVSPIMANFNEGFPF